MTEYGEVTRLLRRMSSEQGEARKQTYDEVVQLVYQDLRRRARQQLSKEGTVTVQPTVLVHEAYERLAEYRMPYENREHFLNVAASAMRRLLVEHARKARAAKRGGGQPAADLELDSAAAQLPRNPELLVDIDQALSDLRPEQVQLVELRYFAGFTLDETAQIIGIKAETAKKRWEAVRTLLYDKLEGWNVG